MPTERTLRVAHGIRSNAEKPRECALVDEAYVTSPPPSLEKDDRGQILRERPIGGTPEAIDVDRLRMSLEQGAEGRRVAPDSVAPQLSIGHGPHTLGMSARDEFPGPRLDASAAQLEAVLGAAEQAANVLTVQHDHGGRRGDPEDDDRPRVVENDDEDRERERGDERGE